MANFNRKFGSGTKMTETDKNVTENTRIEEAKTGREVGSAGDTARMPSPTRSSTPSGTRVETRTTAPGGVNQEVWEQAEAQVSSSFAGLDDKARNDAVQARYDSMVKSDQEVKDWAGGDTEILGDIGQKESK